MRSSVGCSVQPVGHPCCLCHLPRSPNGGDDRSSFGRGAPGGLCQYPSRLDVDLPLAGKDLPGFRSACSPENPSLLFSNAGSSRAGIASVFCSRDCRTSRHSRLSAVSGVGRGIDYLGLSLFFADCGGRPVDSGLPRQAYPLLARKRIFPCRKTCIPAARPENQKNLTKLEMDGRK